MANHKSALKRIKTNAKRAERNKAVRTRVRSMTKAVRQAVETKSADLDQSLLAAIRFINAAASKGVIPKTRASRKISRLTKLVNRSKA